MVPLGRNPNHSITVIKMFVTGMSVGFPSSVFEHLMNSRDPKFDPFKTDNIQNPDILNASSEDPKTLQFFFRFPFFCPPFSGIASCAGTVDRRSPALCLEGGHCLGLISGLG